MSPVKALLVALRNGPLTLPVLSDRTGYTYTALLRTIENARIEGHDIAALPVDGGQTLYEYRPLITESAFDTDSGDEARDHHASHEY